MVLLIGADRLGNISDVLHQRGFSEQVHVKGRKPNAQRGWDTSRGDIRLVVLFTDFLGHNVMQRFRRLAKQNGIPFVACRRSVVSLSQALDRLDQCTGCSGCSNHGDRDSSD